MSLNRGISSAYESWTFEAGVGVGVGWEGGTCVFSSLETSNTSRESLETSRNVEKFLVFVPEDSKRYTCQSNQSMGP